MTEITHIETSPLIYPANQWTGFYVIETVMKGLNVDYFIKILISFSEKQFL